MSMQATNQSDFESLNRASGVIRTNESIGTNTVLGVVDIFENLSTGFEPSNKWDFVPQGYWWRNFVTTNAIQTDVEETNPNVRIALREFNYIISTVPSEKESYDSEDVFAESIEAWFLRYKELAVETITTCHEGDYVDDAVMSSILMSIGVIDHNESINLRYEFLMKFLNKESSELRYGAIMGLSNLDYPKAISRLKNRQDKETNPALRAALRSVISQLQETEQE